MKIRNKKARLTSTEKSIYDSQFEWYCNNIRNDSKRADRSAWHEVVNHSPRLANYKGALP